VFAPLKDYAPGIEPSNNDSLVLHVKYGATSVLLEGDAEAPIEQSMLNEPDLKSTLLNRGGRGIGRSLIEAVSAWARERGCGRLYWHTQRHNDTARRLYDRIGEYRDFIVYTRPL